MDSTDYKIVEILLEDGRIPMKELAQRVALSAPAVAERVKRLEEENIITGYKAVVDYDKLGKKINVLINVGTSVQGSEKFMEFVKGENSIIECYQVTGPYCKILKARLDDIAALEKLIGKIQTFGNTETFIILSSIEKENIINDIKNT
ncbi:Lrp/AsnC family transcriptional regulator [Clostridium sp. CX1]|uniref:Lrp/AsnC family transcriptional regulator n=1 Tax=Clostridium tanneri TaxID=3037988 RepID=A0ABU4JWZ7_9CLOT|nr:MULTISPECIES: Lrp/AsnC family transcriptional regulator [unclassified Clostridium]MCT8978523.1 Lrp/AsnC family transcriptional regulator [Clostridium sp. CX1]MDW8802674.1 Lrp/AsnC family transcriptional regulator [Clostridium sp. A1-XYC3]